MLREEWQQEMLPIYKVKMVKLDEIATSTERRSIPRINSTEQLKLENNGFMENFEPDPITSTARSWDVVLSHWQTSILL